MRHAEVIVLRPRPRPPLAEVEPAPPEKEKLIRVPARNLRREVEAEFRCVGARTWRDDPMTSARGERRIRG